MSSNDLDGSSFGPRGEPGAGGQAAGPGYPAPEGWENDGFWRDSAIDANYETGLHSPVPPAGGGPREDPGYSYFSDRRGWQSSPRAGAGAGGHGAAQAGAGYGGQPGPGQDRTAAYGAPGSVPPGGPGWTPGPGDSAGPGGPRHGGPRGPRGRRPGRWWRHWTWKKVLATGGALAVLMVLGLFGVYEYLSASATIPAALASANYQNTTVYYNDGKTVIGTIGTVNRQDLTYAEIPKNLQDAVLAAEDRSFWTEGGISPTGILRAAYDDLTSSGGSLSGGSTITQEFVKNYYSGVGAQQTISRKVKEIFIAQKLAKTKSKSWILTNYLNLIYLGDNSYGVAAAAQTYFNQPVSALTIPQDAVIAAIIQQPSNYPQPAFRSSLVARWHYVLNGMAAMGDLTQAQAAAAKFPALATDKAGAPGQATSVSSSGDVWAPYIMNEVYNELTGPRADGGDGLSPQLLETGGLRVVTTISRSMETGIYKAVDANIAAIKATPGAVFPSYVRIGAELQNPSNGEILAMYPGPGQNMSAAKCKEWDCALNTAAYTREQVGSSFKPYVLSAAVAAGMNVKTSTLNANPYLCIPPDNTVAEQMTLSSTKVGGYGLNISCPGLPGYNPVENDGGEIIGNPKQGGGTTVQNALAQSSNTAFTDLAHRVSTGNVIEMAKAMGVNINSYQQGGSNLTNLLHQTGLALGIGSLTVNEQTTMLSTIDDNGVYHQAHIVKYWQSPSGPEQKPAVDTHGVLDPGNPATNAQLDSQVQYAMEMTTVDGTGTAASYGLGNRPIIAKTGTTTGYTSGFFIGAIPQYSLVVGMFVADPSNTAQSLVPLTGGGYGGYWPAKIWNTFAQAEFAGLPTENFQNPVFSGATWNQIGKITPKPTVTCVVDGKKKKIAGKTCPTPAPTPTCSYDGQQNCATPTTAPTPTPTCSYPGEQYTDGCTTSGAPGPAASPSCSSSQFGNCVSVPASPQPCSFQGQSGCSSGTAGPTPQASPSKTKTKGGLALAGTGLLLPGSLVGAAESRRRRRARHRRPR